MSQDVRWDDAALEELLTDPEGPIGRDLRRRALDVEAAGKRLLSQHGSGRIYKRTKPDRIHQASAPGEPPAPDTGQLRAALGHTVDSDGVTLYADIGYGVDPDTAAEREGDTSIADVAKYLELGTRHIAPRPFLRPALLAAEGEHEV